MSWNIGLISNTVTFSRKCAEALMAIAGDNGDSDNDWPDHEILWNDIEELKIDDKNYQLYFDEDHGEHMDFLNERDDILDVLLKHKVNGDITFASVEGDNAGQCWGYRFKDGVLTELVGEIVYKEV